MNDFGAGIGMTRKTFENMGLPILAMAACGFLALGGSQATAETELLTLSPKALTKGVRVYSSPRTTASATGENRPAPIVIGRAPDTFHCAISDMVILQSGKQPARRDGSRACSVFLDDGAWMLRARNVQMHFKEGLNTRVECQAICMATLDTPAE